MKTAFGKTYLFKKPYLAMLQGAADTIGYLLFRRQSAKMPSEVKKVLVSRIDHFGDVFIASSILPHLKAAYPGARIDFLAGEWAWGYLRSNPFINRVLVYNAFRHNRNGGFFKKAFGAIEGFFRNVRDIRAEGYDLAIDLRAYPFNSIPVLYLGGVKYIAGFSTGGFGFLLNNVVHYRTGVHETAHINDALTALGTNVPLRQLRPSFTPPKTALKEASRVLEGLGIPEGEDYVLIHTGAGNPGKLWKKEEWQGVIDRIVTRHGVKVVAYDPVYGDLLGCTYLPALISFELFAAVAKRASVFIGLDSMPAHLAASFNTPTVVVWCGINDSVQWRPVGESVSIIKKDVACSPCFLKNGCKSMDCMRISAEDCMREAGRYLKYEKPSKVIWLKV